MPDAENRLNIAFLSQEHAHDKCSYSGSLYYMGKALERHCGNVTYLERIVSWESRYLGRIMREGARRLLGRQLIPRRLLFVAKKDGELAAQRLARSARGFDAIIAPDCVPAIAFLRTQIPVLLPLDVTFRMQRDYYPEYSRLLAICARQGEMIEQAAFQNASHLLFSSPWAARSAIEAYGVSPRKVHARFFGANLDCVPEREHVLKKSRSARCRLLFMGIGWERKGGDIAFETLLRLEEMGIEAELMVCGSIPPASMRHSRMKVIPYLDKNDETQAREIEKLYAQSDFLILPTRADCAPNVFKEANAFGLPAVTAHTGGVADIVRDGINGYVLPYTARGEAYAQIIAELCRDERRYQQLVRSSRALFDECLNWDAWAIAVKRILDETLAEGRTYD